MFKIRISKTTTVYGYLSWNKSDDFLMQQILGEKRSVPVRVNRIALGTKRIDWKYRRVYLGKAIAQGIAPDQAYFLLSVENGILEVTTSEK